MRISKGWSHFFSGIALSHLLVPSFVDVCIGCSVEHLLVLDSLEYALLCIVNDAHVSRAAKRARLSHGRLPDGGGCLAARAELGGAVRGSQLSGVSGAGTCRVGRQLRGSETALEHGVVSALH